MRASIASRGGRSRARAPYLYMLKRLGLTPGLKLCLDVGDINLYPGTGTQIACPYTGTIFDFGATTAAPTFNGEAGRLTKDEYLSFDGGDYLTINGGNTAAIDALHKDNAAYTIVALMQGVAAGAIQRICGTDGGNNANIGVSFLFAASNSMQIQMRYGGATGLNQASSLLVDALPGLYAISLNESVGTGALLYRKRDALDSDPSTYSTPSASAATYPLQIGAGGNNANPVANGTRLFGFFLWEGVALPQKQLAAISAMTKQRIGA
jgi:hypothetical protein